MEIKDVSQITAELEELLMEAAETEEVSPSEELLETVLKEEADELQTAQEKPAAEPPEKRRELIRPGDGLMAAFLIPIVIMLIIFVQRGIFPFGEESFLRTDMYHQYAPFFSEFQHKLKTGGSLLYSWDVGLGVNFSALFAYYLASPVNWLLWLCPEGYVIEFMTYLIVFKTGLCGLTMTWYLHRHCRTKDFGAAFFGIFYALSGYMAAYSWNIMWLDCIILFPLIMLGLERLTGEGRGVLYCVTLGLSILSNYYISIMTCIFMVIYFFVLLILEKGLSWEKFIARSFQFCIYSLLAGALAAVVLLPEICALQMTASGDIAFPKTFTQYFPVFDMIARHIGNVESEIGLEHWPNLYCGVAVLMLFLLYLAEQRIPMKEKAVYCLLLLFFMASFSMNILNFIWHGFHYPNSLPCRQSYIYIFLVLFMCYRAYLYLKDTPGRYVTGAFWGAVIFVLLAQKLVTAEHFHFIVYYVAILFLALYLGAVFLYRRGEKSYVRAALFALAVVSVEAAVNMTVTSVSTTSRTSYTKDNAAVRKLTASIEPDDFYRIEKVTRKTKNDGAWMHFPSVSLFSSTANADLTALFKKLGCESSTNAYSITGSTPLVDALLSVRYGLYSEKPKENGFRVYLAEDDETYLYENKYTLPLGFLVDTDFESRWNLGLGQPADVQNSLADSVGAPLILELTGDSTVNGQSLTFVPEESGEYYAYVSNKKIDKVKVTTADDTKTYNNVDRGYLLELGDCPAGREVVLTAEGSSEQMWADIYRFSEDGLAAVHEKLSEHPWKLSSWTDTSLTGTVYSDSGGRLFTSIPYDEGWSILVDGLEWPAEPVLDAFLSIRLTGGEHVIEMRYCPDGLKPGGALTASALLVLLIIMIAEGRVRRRFRFAEDDPEDWEEDPEAWNEVSEDWGEDPEAWEEASEAWEEKQEDREENLETGDETMKMPEILPDEDHDENSSGM